MSAYFVATNALFNQCSSLYCLSLSNSVGAFAREGGPELVPVLFDGYGNNAMALNQVLTWAYKNDVDGVFLIGPNVGWDPDDLSAIIRSDKDVLSAPILYNGRYVITMGEKSRLQVDEETGEIVVNDASLDFFFLRKSVIKALCETHASVTYNGEEVKMVLQSGDLYSAYHPDAAILAYRLMEAGYHVWMNPSLKIKTMSQSLSQSNLKEDLERELKPQ